MEYISLRPDRYIINADFDRLENEFDNFNIDPAEPVDEEENNIDQEIFDIEFANYFNMLI